MSLHNLAKHIQSHGRGNDTQLMHVTPRELGAMQGIARAHGGSLTVNPHTGLPEAGFLDNLIPSLLPLAAGAALAATGIGAPLAAGIVGAGTGLITNDLNKGLMAGLGAFGGASLAGGFLEAGASALAEPAIASGAEVAGQSAFGTGAQAWGTDASIAANAAQQGATAVPAEGALSGVSQATNPAMQPSTWDKMQAGFKATNFNADYLKNNMFPLGAAAAPLLMGGLNSSSGSDSSTSQQPSYIRPYTYQQNQNQNYAGAGTPYFNQRMVAREPVDASDWGTRPVFMAEGGEAAVNDEVPVSVMSAMGDAIPTSAMNAMGNAIPVSAMNASPMLATNSGIASLQPNMQAQFVAPQQRYAPNIRAVSPDVQQYNQTLADRARAEYITGAQPAAFTPRPTPTPTPTAGTSTGTVASGGTSYNPTTQTYTAAPKPTAPAANAAGTGTGNPYILPDGGAGFRADNVTPTYPSAVNYGGGSAPVYFYGQPIGTDPNYNPNTGRNDLPAGSNVGYVDVSAGETGTMQTPVVTMPDPQNAASSLLQDPNYVYAGDFQGTPVYVSQRTGEYVNEIPTISYSSNNEYDSGGNLIGGLDWAYRNAMALPDYGSNGNAKAGGLMKSYAMGGDIGVRYPSPDDGDMVGAHQTMNMAPQYPMQGTAANYAAGGISNLGGYSDGGRLLKGPGDGVSDDIPAQIGARQPARLADGEFVIPARIVSEIGNGSTDAGAKRLYAMMDRVQANRKKTVGKGKVAVNSKAYKHLPA